MEPSDSSLSHLRHGCEGQGSRLAAHDHTARLTTYTIVFGERVTVTVDAAKQAQGEALVKMKAIMQDMQKDIAKTLQADMK